MPSVRRVQECNFAFHFVNFYVLVTAKELLSSVSSLHLNLNWAVSILILLLLI
jgi:hypothetical protein